MLTKYQNKMKCFWLSVPPDYFCFAPSETNISQTLWARRDEKDWSGDTLTQTAVNHFSSRPSGRLQPEIRPTLNQLRRESVWDNQRNCTMRRSLQGKPGVERQVTHIPSTEDTRDFYLFFLLSCFICRKQHDAKETLHDMTSITTETFKDTT